MRLAMEIPTSHLAHLSPLTDFDFAIAHRIVQDLHYRKFYLEQRKEGREIILDNGYHELGKADPQMLEEAVNILEPRWIISPDNLEDAPWTIDRLKESLDKFSRGHIAVVLCGIDVDQRLEFIEYLFDNRIDAICFPYRKPRLQWIDELEYADVDFDGFAFHHFLGMQSIEETRNIATRFPHASIDTSKAIKWGYKTMYLDKADSLHGAWPDYNSYLDAPGMDQAQTEITLWNIAYLRKVLNG